MRRLRIAFLSPGTFRHVGAYLSFFRDRGHDVHWITYNPPPECFGVATHSICNVDPLRAAGKWRYLLAGIAARGVLRGIAPDIVHGHYVTSAGTICLLSGFRPYVLTAHGSDVIKSMRSWMWRKVLRSAFRQASCVNVVSEELAECAAELGVPKPKMLLATLGVDTALFKYRPAPEGGTPLRLICTRKLSSVYDAATIIAACEVLRRRGIDFVLTFVAGGPLQEQLEADARARGLDGVIHFRGGFRNEELPNLLAGQDIYVSASRWDGTSISLLEAMACGVFPVLSRIRSNASWVTDGATALMFDSGNPAALAEALQRAAADAALRARAAARNRETVELRGDRVKNMLAMEQRFFEIVEGRQTRCAESKGARMLS